MASNRSSTSKPSSTRDAPEAQEFTTLQPPEQGSVVAPPQEVLSSLDLQGYEIKTEDHGGFSFSYPEGYAICIFPVPNSTPQEWWITADAAPHSDDTKVQENKLSQEIERKCNPSYKVVFDGTNTIDFINHNILQGSIIDHEECASFIATLGVPDKIQLPDDSYTNIQDRFFTAVESIGEVCAQSEQAWSQIAPDMRVAILYTAAYTAAAGKLKDRNSNHQLNRMEQQVASLLHLTKDSGPHDGSFLIRTREQLEKIGGVEGIIRTLTTDPFWESIRNVPRRNNPIVDVLFPTTFQDYLKSQGR